MRNIKIKTSLIFIIIAAVMFFLGVYIFNTFIADNKPNITKNQAKLTYMPEQVVTPSSYIALPTSGEDITNWNVFSEKNLHLTMKYPDEIILDPRQTSEGRIYAFIFAEDEKEPLPGKVTTLYIADTNKKGLDGFSAFRKGDCEKECPISYKNTQWVNFNNAYGIKNPLPDDVHNYYITDKDQSQSVVNVYIGGYKDMKEKDVQSKIDIFEDVIKTIQFSSTASQSSQLTPSPGR